MEIEHIGTGALPLDTNMKRLKSLRNRGIEQWRKICGVVVLKVKMNHRISGDFKVTVNTIGNGEDFGQRFPQRPVIPKDLNQVHATCITPLNDPTPDPCIVVVTNTIRLPLVVNQKTAEIVTAPGKVLTEKTGNFMVVFFTG